MTGRVVARVAGREDAWGAALAVSGTAHRLRPGARGEVLVARADGAAIVVARLDARSTVVEEPPLAVRGAPVALDVCAGPSGPVVVWTDPAAQVVARARTRGGWGPPEPLSSPAVPATLCEVAAGGGRVAAVWGAGDLVGSSARPDGAGWTTDGPLGAGATPQVAVGPGGEALAAWIGESGAVSVAARGRDSAWAPPRQLTEPWHGASGLRLGVAPDGAAALSWTAADAVVRLAHRPPGEDWAAPVPVSEPGEPAYGPRLAAGAEGALVVWHRADAAIRAAFVPAGGEPLPPVTLSGPDAPGTYPSAAIAGDGTAVVAWWDDEGSVLARRGDGLRWSAPQTLCRAGGAMAPPQIASGTDGVVVVAWSERPDQM